MIWLTDPHLIEPDQDWPQGVVPRLRVWLDEIAAGDEFSMMTLGLIYEQGRGVDKDLVAAYKWYLRGAKAGSLHATFLIGRMYDSGGGAPKDPQKAADYFFDAFSMPQRGHFDQYIKNAEDWSVDTRKALQRRLIQAGNYDGKADGNFGRGTVRALRELPKNVQPKAASEPAETPSEVLEGIGDINELERLD